MATERERILEDANQPSLAAFLWTLARAVWALCRKSDETKEDKTWTG